MNSRLIQAIIAGIFGVVLIGTILTGDGNVIGQAAMFGMVFSFLLGAVSPKMGIYLMIVLAGYSDLIKRLMALETRISMLDLTYILGMAPMALAGVVVSCFLKKVFYADIQKRDVATFGIATVFLGLGALTGLRSEGGLRALRVVADYGAFSYLLFVLPILFPSRDEFVKLIRFTLLVFVPVALYGIWQRLFGLADFEYAYLLTGLSQEWRQLEDVEVRPFSTLNAATSLTMVTASAVVLTLIVRRAGHLGRLSTMLLVLLFTWGCFMTFTRVGWAVLLASVCLIPVLRYRTTTLAMYVGGFLMFLLVVWQSDYLMQNLHHWQDQLYGSKTVAAGEEQGLRITTLSDRLIGFQNMKLRENWQPFGVKERGMQIEGLSGRYSTTFSHDMISGFLFKFGYVPLGALFLGTIISLFTLHRMVFRLPLERQRFAQLALAGAFGALCSLATGGTAFQFPANIFLWFFFGFALITIWESRSVQRKREADKLSADARHRQSPVPRLRSGIV